MELNDEENFQLSILHGISNWTKGTIFQGNRLLNILNEENAILIRMGNDILNAHNELGSISEILRWEEDFFIYSIDRAIFFLKQGNKFYPEFTAYISKIESELGQGVVKDLRDMRTHIDAYFKGKGKSQKRFMFETNSPVQNIGGKIISSATSTISYPNMNMHLIGGRLNVQKAVKIFCELKNDIINTCEKYTREMHEKHLP
ncbi:hypothetical protein FACS189450_01260 [Spirochaetia bacterium]|nr:hypothetical protein FACS189450_01260 [Spirochaetia bacterium]